MFRKFPVHVDYRREQFVDSPAGECRCEYDGNVGNEFEAVLNLLFGFGAVKFQVVGKVPFINNYNGGTRSVVDVAADMGILRGNKLSCIEYQYRDIAAFDSTYCSDRAVFFDSRLGFSAATKAGGIEERDSGAFEVKLGVKCVAGRSGYRTDDRTVFPGQGVEERRFPGVCSSGDRYPDRMGTHGLGLERRHRSKHRLHETTNAGVVVSADRVWFAKAERVEVVDEVLAGE